MKIREWLREEIDARGLTQRAVGERIGLDDDKMSRVMRGARELSGDELLSALTLFGYPTPFDRARGDDLRQIVRRATALRRDQREALAAFLRALGS